jgi:hypothetical protein
MKEIPKYWYVLYKNRDEFNVIDKYYNKGWTYNEPTNNKKYGYINITIENNWYSSRTANATYKNYILEEITFEKWQELICGIKPISTKLNLNKLLNILKFINNYGKQI